MKHTLIPALLILMLSPSYSKPSKIKDAAVRPCMRVIDDIPSASMRRWCRKISDRMP